MDVLVTDFNGSDQLFNGEASALWADVADVLGTMPLHLKASDQSGLQGNPIFDVVGTNAAIKVGMVAKGWKNNIRIPPEMSFLGTDVDFAKQFVFAEVQFSNYPYLLNNIIRGELFYKAAIGFDGEPTRGVIIIAKAKMFPSSNGTLYYEQAVSQTRALVENDVFDVPMRIVGLSSPADESLPVLWTEYHNARTSRTVVTQVERRCVLSAGRTAKSRHTITLDAV